MALPTYDPTTARGQVRLLIGDTDIDNAIYDDAEVDAFLSMEGSVVPLAASRALLSLAADKAKLAVRISRGNVSDDMTAIARELRETAKQLRDDYATSGVGPMEAVISPSWERFSWEKNVVLERENEVREP